MKQLIFNLSDEGFASLMDGFCREKPIPQKTNMVDEKPIMEDEYTQEEWLKRFVVQKVERVARKGWDKLTLDGNPIDETKVAEILENL